MKRRLAAQYVREARDRLTSSSGTRPAFDYELLRQYAQNRLSASLVILLLVATVGFMSSIWSGALRAGAWTGCGARASTPSWSAKCSAISRTTDERDFARLRGDCDLWCSILFYGLAWMFILIHPVGADESSSTFMLFRHAAGRGRVQHAGIEPADSSFRRNFSGYRRPLRSTLSCRERCATTSSRCMALTAQGYFAALTYRLYSEHSGDTGSARARKMR